MLRTVACLLLLAPLAGCADGLLASGARPFVRATFWNNSTSPIEFEFRAGDVAIGPATIPSGGRASAAADYQDARLSYEARAGEERSEGMIVATEDVVHVLVEWRGRLRVRGDGAEMG